MTECAPGEIRIRNRRYRPRIEIAGIIFLTMAASGVLGLLLTRGLERMMLDCILVGVIGILALGAYGWLQVWDFRRGRRSEQVETLGTVTRDWLLGFRRKERGPSGPTPAIRGLRWLLPTRVSIRDLKLGESVEIDPPLCRFSANSVERIDFARDPAEDYAESSVSTPLYEATILMLSGREFRLMVGEVDAGRLRDWAAGKGIAVREADGFGCTITERGTAT